MGSRSLGNRPRLETDLVVELKDDGTQLTDNVHHWLGIGRQKTPAHEHNFSYLLTTSGKPTNRISKAKTQ